MSKFDYYNHVITERSVRSDLFPHMPDATRDSLLQIGELQIKLIEKSRGKLTKTINGRKPFVITKNRWTRVKHGIGIGVKTNKQIIVINPNTGFISLLKNERVKSGVISCIRNFVSKQTSNFTFYPTSVTDPIDIDHLTIEKTLLKRGAKIYSADILYGFETSRTFNDNIISASSPYGRIRVSADPDNQHEIGPRLNTFDEQIPGLYILTPEQREMLNTISLAGKTYNELIEEFRLDLEEYLNNS